MGGESLDKIELSAEEIRIPVKSAVDAGLPGSRKLSQEEVIYYRGLIEAILFLSSEQISLGVLARKCDLDRSDTRVLVDGLVDEYEERNSGIILCEIAGGYQFRTAGTYGEILREIFQGEKKGTLTKSALETLSIISYKQPVTLPEIEEIRGVNTRIHITTLLSYSLIKSQGYRPVPGRPTLYVTTREFLTHFSLNSLTDLPILKEVKELNFDNLD